MTYSINPISDNCYPGTSVLINKFDIRDDAKLNEVETVLVSARSAEWMEHPTVDSFDFAHYKAIHHLLFSDLYDWAGQNRTVNISKKGTHFCPAEEIERRTKLIFGRSKTCNYYKALPHNDFVEEIVDFYCTANELHPFREGNGRTQRVFLSPADPQCGLRYQLGRCGWGSADDRNNPGDTGHNRFTAANFP